MRNIGVFLVTAICGLMQNTVAQELPEWRKMYSEKEVQEKFANPPLFYAPHTFWFWDDTLKDESVAAEMAAEMAKQRLNPGYAHPRSGFDPSVAALPLEQYLEKPWFNSFGKALQEAKNQDMTLGYCDDYNWPSGQIGGKILEQHPELEARYLSPKRYYAKGGETVVYDNVDFAVAGRLENEEIDAGSLRIIGEGKSIKWTAPEGKWVIYTYTEKFHPGIDGGRVNYLSPKLMKTFIPMVHEKYLGHFGSDMGNHIPGVFVDNEGDYGWQIAWSDFFAAQYKKDKKRDIRLWLPLLTEKDKDGLFVKARCDWFDVVSDVYNTCYIKPLVNWLKKRNMYYISNLWEESLLLQTQAVGDLMRTNRCVTMPGTDCLEMKSQDVHDFKETQSVAEFENRPFMSEIMGVAGWIQSPEMMKMTINSITSFGINHVVPHGIYMNRNLTTIPFPTDWFVENPYWRYMHYWTDFARRAAFVTRHSQLVADVLLVQPLESVWAFSEGYFADELLGRDEPWDNRAVETDQVYSEAMRKMNEANIDFLIADNHYLSCSNVQTNQENPTIRIKDHDFRAIVLPPTYILARSSMKKIYDFAKQGGVVLTLGALPTGSPEKGLNDEFISKLSDALRKLPNVIDCSADKDVDIMNNMVTTLYKKIKLSIRLENVGRLYTMHRRMGHKDLYWLANNTNDKKEFTAKFRDGKGNVELWDCETGDIRTLSARENGEYIDVPLILNPFEGYWVVFNPENKDAVRSDGIDNVDLKSTVHFLDTLWAIRYPETNTVCKTTAKVLYSNDTEVDSKKLQIGYNDSNWPYYNKQKKESYQYAYWRSNVPVGATSVVVPDYLVGKDIWVDNKKMHVAERSILLPKNTRLLAFVLRENELQGIEPFVFTVDAATNKGLESWYAYGLQQYTGFLDYETTLQINKLGSQVILDLGEVKYMAEVFVNGKSTGARLWAPFQFDISKELKEGTNTIKIRVGNLIANSMWMQDDMNKLRLWGWRGTPDLLQCDAGLFGPIRIETKY